MWLAATPFEASIVHVQLKDAAEKQLALLLLDQSGDLAKLILSGCDDEEQSFGICNVMSQPYGLTALRPPKLCPGA
jgi:hypothetical protein